MTVLLTSEEADRGAVRAAPPASEWRVAVALARGEARRLARVAILPALLAVFMSTGTNELVDQRSTSINMAFTLLLLAAVTLVSSHRAVTRPRRDGSEELLSTLPASERARTAGHLLAVAAPTAMAAAVLGASLAVTEWRAMTFGDLIPGELAVGPLLVAGAGCLGVLLARLWARPFTPFVACVAIAAVELGVNTPSLAGSGARWLAFWVEGTLWWLLPRHTNAHALYLAGLVGMAVVGALARHGVTRRLAVAGVAVVALTAGAAAWQMRQPAATWRAANAMFAAPETVQECWTDGGVRYCAFPRFRPMVEYLSGRVAAVRAAVPPERWPAGVVVSQRVTALDLQYVGAAEKALPHVPALVDRTIRQPDDGAIHPGLEFGWSPSQLYGLGVQVGATVVGLPLVPHPSRGEVCQAAGQARAVLALWLGAHADGGGGLPWLLDMVGETGGPERDFVFPVHDVDVYGGFAVSVADARLARALVARPGAEVRALVARHWDTLAHPATGSAEMARLFGVPGDFGGPAPPRVVTTAPDLVRLGGPCP